MPWVGPRVVFGETPSADYYDPVVGPPDNLKVPQWPTPGSRRVRPKWRWITEPLLRPMAQRLLVKVEYSKNDPVAQGGYDFTEYCWIDLWDFKDFELWADPGPSPYGTRIKGGVSLVAGNDGTAPGDVVERYDLTTPGDLPYPLTSDCRNELLWRKPTLGLSVGPNLPVCGACEPDLPSGLQLSITGGLSTDPIWDLQFDAWAEGDFPLTVGFPCVFSFFDDSEIPPFTLHSVLHQVSIIDGIAPGTKRFRIHLAHIDPAALPFPSSARFDTVDFALVDGKFDCLSNLPIGLSPFQVQVGAFDWTNASVTVTASGAAVGRDTTNDTYPWKRVTTYGFSECYPVDSFTANDRGLVMLDLVGLFAKMTPNQSINSDPNIQFSQIVRQLGGDWLDLDPAGDDGRIIRIPEPWNHVKIHGQLTTQTDQSALTLRPFINGNGFLGIPIQADRSTSAGGQSASCNFTTGGWVQVTPGDEITIKAVQGGGSVSSSTNNSWVQIEGAYFPLD